MYKFLQSFIQEVIKALNLIKPYINCMIVYLISFILFVFISDGISVVISLLLLVLATVMACSVVYNQIK